MGQIPSHRLPGALEALEMSRDMLTSQYIADTVLAYLQSPAFFVLWFGTLWTVLGFRLWREK